MDSLAKKMRRRATRMRLQPIRVFCFHHVSDGFEPETMVESDWIQAETYKRIVLSLKENYSFLPLQEAYDHIAKDMFRTKCYAVLTADDGWASLHNVLPWLSEQDIPLTLFLNPGYFDGMHFRERNTERYLLEMDVKRISDTYSNVFFGMHGWEHDDVSKQDENEFRKNVGQSIQALKDYRNFVPFFAYPWGRRNAMNNRVLKEFNLIPVLMDGMRNYNDASAVHRELLQ